MKITKLGHCAMVLDVEGVKLLTDPGNYTTEAQEALTDLHGVVITHEHADHLHVESLKKVIANNPTAVIVSNKAVAKIIGEAIADTAVIVVGDGESTDINGVSISGHGSEHALVYPPDRGLCENTGYFIAERFYFPGDNFYNPHLKIDILALPVAGPWMKIREAIDFAKEIKARVAFGVHDGMILPPFRSFVGRFMEQFCQGTQYVLLKDGETKEF